jgi:hypothetical protein
MAKRPEKARDFKFEYARRIRNALARGQTRAQARGHSRAADIQDPKPAPIIDRHSPLERALQLMRNGESQKAAAKQVGVSTERLRRYQKLNTQSERIGKTWKIVDTREVSVLLATKGNLQTVTVQRHVASDIGKYWVGVNKFLETNKRSFLDPFEGLGIRDVRKKLHPFETRPNVLRRLDSAGDFTFIDIYRQTAES